MSSTLDLFTKSPFTMSDGTTRRALVERVSLPMPDDVTLLAPGNYGRWQIVRGGAGALHAGIPPSAESALLIRATHEWCAEQATRLRIVGALQDFGIHAKPKLLVEAAHLIADALEIAP